MVGKLTTFQQWLYCEGAHYEETLTVNRWFREVKKNLWRLHRFSGDILCINGW